MITRVVVFGAGTTGSRVARFASDRGLDVVATVRSRSLGDVPYRVTNAPVLDVARAEVDAGTHAVICFPPDGVTDDALAPLLAHAAAVSYVSTTGVYGPRVGIVDDGTPVDPEARPKVLAAEAAYRAVGGTVLRAPGIYAADRGLHVRVLSGKHAIPGDGHGFGSRIHADDLATLLLASGAVRGDTFVVGDLEPARQCDVVAWICQEYGCPMPPSVPPGEVPESLRGDRRVDGSRALRVLGVTLAYPTFREGMRRS